MKKFKVIEESRFLKKQDMQNLIGGDCAPVTSICNVGNPHESCGILHIKYEYCGPGFAPEGYNNGPGGESCVGSNIEYKPQIAEVSVGFQPNVVVMAKFI